MADEFVDFYEALNLPLEADRKEVRKRINEVYLEAQRNLDHRNFQTRVKHQEMFEVVLPRARYILLDEGRRDEYDHLVRASRLASAPAPQIAPAPVKAPQEKSFGQGDTSGFKLAESEEEPAGKAPPIEALPNAPIDLAMVEAQREASWAKWKQGLEAATTREEVDTQPANPSPSRPAPSAASPRATVPPQPAQASAESAPERKPRPQANPISFNFDNNSNAPSPDDDEETVKAKLFELEKQKAERKRVVMKEILDSVTLKGTIIGGLGAAIPLGALLIYVVGHFYPRDSAPQLPVPSSVIWLVGLAILAGGAFFAASELAKFMRNKATLELSMLSLEDLLRRVGRTY